MRHDMMMPGFCDIATLRSLDHYVSLIEEHCDGDSTLFRGQPVDEPLLPKIARLNARPSVGEAEAKMLFDWKLQALPYLEIQPQSDWDWLALAQHFGMATRLLDWTLNPFAALWFAVERPASLGATGVVWFFEVHDDDYLDQTGNPEPLSISKTMVFRPRHLTRRIIAQSGWFTAHPSRDDGQRGYASLENDPLFTDRLKKLKIPEELFPDLRRQLDRFGVNAASLFGGPDGLSRHLEWLHSYYHDEAPGDRE